MVGLVEVEGTAVDPDGGPVTLVVRLGDQVRDAPVAETGAWRFVVHTALLSPGSLVVRVEATDEEGEMGLATRAVFVGDAVQASSEYPLPAPGSGTGSELSYGSEPSTADSLTVLVVVGLLVAAAGLTQRRLRRRPPGRSRIDGHAGSKGPGAPRSTFPRPHGAESLGEIGWGRALEPEGGLLFASGSPGFQTCGVRVDLDQPDEWGLRPCTYWYEVQSLGNPGLVRGGVEEPMNAILLESRPTRVHGARAPNPSGPGKWESGARMGGRAVTLLLVMVVLLPPSALSAWEAPEGQPYGAKKRVLLDEPAWRDDLSFGSDMVAWVQRPWNESRYSFWGGSLKLLDMDGWDRGQQPQLIEHVFLSNRSANPEVSQEYVVWKDHQWEDFHGTPHVVQTDLYAYDRSQRETLLLARGAEELTRPHLDGSVVAWLSKSPGSGRPDEIHQIDLAAETGRVWASPLGICGQEAWPLQGRILLFEYSGCRDDDPGGLYLWNPETEVLENVTHEPVIMVDVDGGRIVWVAYRQGQGRGANLYLYDAATGLQRRLTWSEGRETLPSLSGDLVVWADVRSERTPQPLYNLYFQHLLTFNEYQLEDTWNFTAGPALHQGDLVYGDEAGRLWLAQLPTAANLLTVGVVVGHESGLQGDVLRLDLDSDTPIEARWDLDLDGSFDDPDPLQVPLGDAVDGRAGVLGRAVDATGRVAVVGFAFQEAARFATAGTGPALFRQSPHGGGENPPRTEKGEPISVPTSWMTIAALGVALALASGGRRK